MSGYLPDIEAAIGFSPDPAAVAALCARLDRLRAGPAPASAEGEGRPLVILTPLGLAARAETERLVLPAARGGLVRRRIADWGLASAGLYLRSLDRHELEKALGFAHLWETLYPGGQAECWDTADAGAYRTLLRAKPALRRALPRRAFTLRLPDRSLTAVLHPFHVPDPGDLERDTALLAHLATEG